MELLHILLFFMPYGSRIIKNAVQFERLRRSIANQIIKLLLNTIVM